MKDIAQVLKEAKLDALIVTNPINIFYLSGFRGISLTERESILVAAPKTNTLITARLYQNEAQKLAGNNLKVEIADERNRIFGLTKKALSGKNRIGFESEDLKFSEYKAYKKALPKTNLIPTTHLIENLRSIKTDLEIANIEKAQIISQKAFEKIIKIVKPGQTEEKIAEVLEKIIKELGGQGLAFETIIASGPNAGFPHHVTSKKPIIKGDVLLFDFGAKYSGFCADLSRTIFVGKAKDEPKNIFHHVLGAQQAALAVIEKDIKSSHPHETAVGHFKKHNLENYFLHGLGHGIGLEIHEKPHLRPAKKGTKIKEVLEEGMVFSVEPGLYFPWGGVRIEDLVAIKNGKAKILGTLQKELIQI